MSPSPRGVAVASVGGGCASGGFGVGVCGAAAVSSLSLGVAVASAYYLQPTTCYLAPSTYCIPLKLRFLLLPRLRE